jgi:hypothetical protein
VSNLQSIVKDASVLMVQSPKLSWKFSLSGYSHRVKGLHSTQDYYSIFRQIKEFIDEHDIQLQDTAGNRYNFTQKTLSYQEKLDTWRRNVSVSHLLPL